MNYQLNLISIEYKDEDPYYTEPLLFTSKNPEDAHHFLKSMQEEQFINLAIDIVESRTITSQSFEPLDYETDMTDDYADAVSKLWSLLD